MPSPVGKYIASMRKGDGLAFRHWRRVGAPRHGWLGPAFMAVAIAVWCSLGGAGTTYGVEAMSFDPARFAGKAWSNVRFESFLQGTKAWMLVAEAEAGLCASDEYRQMIGSMRNRSGAEWFRVWKVTGQLRTMAAAYSEGLLAQPVDSLYSGQSWDYWHSVAALGIYSVTNRDKDAELSAVEWDGADRVLAEILQAFAAVFEGSQCEKSLPQDDARRVRQRGR